MWQSSKGSQVITGRRDIDTVLVLGAGASAHLGYPLGTQLSDCIISNTRDPASASFKTFETMGFTRNEITHFNQEFGKAVAPTVDDFLSRREEFVKIGRAAIAQELIKYETMAPLQRRSDNWYLLLREKIISAIEQTQHGPMIVTFNYDRSLDKFVTDLISSNFPQRAADSNDVVQILHVHGRLGYLDSDSTPDYKRPYNCDPTPEQMLQSSEGIRVVSELKNDYGKEMVVAQAAIAKAKKVFFLGFSYDDTNLDRLRVSTNQTEVWKGENKFFGTAFRLPAKRIEELKKDSQGRLFLGSQQLAIAEFFSDQAW